MGLIGSGDVHAESSQNHDFSLQSADLIAERHDVWSAEVWEIAQARPPVDLGATQREARRRELEHFLDDIRDERLDVARRQRAVQILLSKDWPEAAPALRDALLGIKDTNGQRAIATAVAEMTTLRPPEALLSPLLDLLSSEDNTVQNAAGKALARYDRRAVGEQLIRRAMDGELSLESRRGAIAALAQHRRTETAHTLIRLTDPTEPEALQKAAYRSLAELTGFVDFGEDRNRWTEWWTEIRHLSDEEFRSSLDAAIIEQNLNLRENITSLTDRLRGSVQRIFALTPEAERDALLASMLADPLPALRLWSLDTIQRAYFDAGLSQTLTERLKAAMRERMIADESPAIRSRLAQQLRQIRDAKAADLALAQLATEKNATVIDAYFSLLARVPRGEAIDPAIDLLGNPKLQASAAAFLLAAIDAQPIQLTDEQKNKAREQARAHLDRNAKPDVQIVTLLGRLADETADQDRISRLMQHDDPAVRLAAADAFVTGIIPIEPLLDRLGDAVLRPKILEAASRRADQVSHFQKILASPLARDDAQRRAWEGALLDISRRLQPTDLVQLDPALAADASYAGLRRAILTAAIEQPNANGNGNAGNGQTEQLAARYELTFRLIELALSESDNENAQQLLDQLEALPGLEPAIRQRILVTRVQLLLQQEKIEEADKLTATIFADHNGAALSRLIESWFAATDRYLQQDKPDQAANLIKRIKARFADHLTGDLAERLKKLSDRLPAPATPAATSTDESSADNSDSPSSPLVDAE